MDSVFPESITFAFPMEKKIEDKELGIITVRRNPRAVRYILKVKNGAVFAVMPLQGEESVLMRFIEESKAVLLEQLSRRPKRMLDESASLEAFSFRLHIFRSERKNFYLSLKDGILHIACPRDTDFSADSVQDTLNRLIEKALKYEARRLLPLRTDELARLHGFDFRTIRIQSSKGRWGSCSSGRTINLSCFLMLLPAHLIDYVLLHELCHTVEMNHGERFWRLMDRVTGGKARALRRELKNHTPSI